jgi:hypothetical protein
MKIDNPIVKEVREARRQILASYDWDCRAMMQDMMQRQWESGRRVVAAPKENAGGVLKKANENK